MSEAPFGMFVVHALTVSSRTGGGEVVLIGADVEERGTPLLSDMFRVLVSRADVPWWKDRLGKRIGLVAQDG